MLSPEDNFSRSLRVLCATAKHYTRKLVVLTSGLRTNCGAGPAHLSEQGAIVQTNARSVTLVTSLAPIYDIAGEQLVS